MNFLKGIFKHDIIMFFLLGVSAIPYFATNQPFTILYAILLTLLFFFSKNQKIDKELIYVLSALFVCIFFQALIFSYFKFYTILGLILRILSAYFTVKLLKKDFIKSYLRLMIFFSIISLFFFIPIFLFPSLLDILIDHTPSFLNFQYETSGIQVEKKTLIVYNLLRETNLNRNPGPFWEPGAFGGLLIIALIFNTIRETKLSNKINWLFFITIITTQSTTSYLALFTFVISYLLFQNYSRSAKLMAILLGIGAIIAFQTIPFLGEKIKNENANTQEAIETMGGDTRMASAILDWSDIKRYPWSGRGIRPETRVDKQFEYIMRNNGFTNFLAEWGIFFFILYFFYYYEGFKNFCEQNNANNWIPAVILAVIFLISFSEDYFGLPFFWSLVFLNLTIDKSGKELNYA